MNKYIFFIFTLLLMAGLTGCAQSSIKTPAQATGNSPEQQRANSRDAQGELSTDVKR